MTEIAQERTAPQGVGEESTAEQMKEKVQGAAAQAQERVGKTAQHWRAQIADNTRKQLDSRSTQAGEQVTAAADALRRVSGQLREDGNATPARYAEQAAQPVDRVGRYLTEASGDRILRDAERVALQRPMLTVAGGAMIGFLLARFIKASGTPQGGAMDGNGHAPNAMPRAQSMQLGGPDGQSSH
jgi:hypothetical protein